MIVLCERDNMFIVTDLIYRGIHHKSSRCVTFPMSPQIYLLLRYDDSLVPMCDKSGSEQLMERYIVSMVP